MRTLFRAVPAAAAVGLALVLTTPASASEVRSAAGVEWSTEFETATAAGLRWIEPSGSFSDDLVLDGTLSNTGDGCYAVWTMFIDDFAGSPASKQAEICGPGSVAVDVREDYDVTTTGYLWICKGTAATSDCAPWETITWWPINQK